ncbi:RNA polymerase I-specific transcription initiation factor RRN6-like protein [Lineolata rhizophorae]|uniref:RNA polymerase I-specific transcription initiation factor RRN6-like protein n=1 Tax=Lineolata rhizophorae TaxID=578093 RepID=A0A6A6P5D0_9PEZI|nr:RNA polymerase I-specific transcription initiation factor RRN6-like protein [Lineolata rhizophorae]
MTDAFPLNYGHFGRATYDRGERKWHFSRKESTAQDVILHLLPGPAATATPSSTNDPAATSTGLSSSRKLTTQAERLTHAFPDLTASFDLLPSLLRTSEAVIAATSAYDPARGELFSTGLVGTTAAGLHKPRARLLATVAGEAGENVKFVLVRNVQQGWDGGNKGSRNAWLSVPTPMGHGMGGLEGVWKGPGAPVMQVRFSARDGDTAALCAVRLPAKVVVFRPYVKGALGNLRKASGPSSIGARGLGIEPHPVLELELRSMGDNAPADVVFNPWYQRQLAAVDDRGAWFVWELDGKRDYSAFWATEVRCGSLPPKIENIGGEDMEVRDDGWARILWVVGVNTLVVCNRRQLVVYDIKEQDAVEMATPELGLKKTTDWILDLRQCPLHKDRLWVVTSTGLFWMHVYTTEDKPAQGNTQDGGAKVLAFWRHFRDPEDISLTICVEALGIDVLVLLFSHVNSTVTTFRFSDVSDINQFPVSIADPGILDLSSAVVKPFKVSDEGDARLTVLGMSLTPLGFKSNSRHAPSGTVKTLLDNSIQFFVLDVLLSDKSLKQCLVYANTSGSNEGGFKLRSDLESIGAISWKREPEGLSQAIVQDDFVVDDDDLVSDGEDNEPLHWAHISWELQPRRSKETLIDLLSVSRTRGYYTAATPENEETGRLTEVAFDRIKSKLHAKYNSQDPGPLAPILRLSRVPTLIPDVDIAAASLDSLVQSFPAPTDGQAPPTLSIISSLRAIDLDVLSRQDPDMQSIACIYDACITLWVQNVPDRGSFARLRLSKERIVREIAVTLGLACSVVRKPAALPAIEDVMEVDEQAGPSSQTDASAAVASAGSSFSLPVRGGNYSSLPSPRALQSSSQVIQSSNQLPIATSTSSRHVPPPIFIPKSPADALHSSLPARPSLPTPEPTPSLRSRTSSIASSITSGLGLAGLVLEPHGKERIKDYTSVCDDEDLDTPLTVSHQQARILAHWSEGANPDTYEWNRTRRAVLTELEESNEDDTEEDSRTRKKAVARREARKTNEGQSTVPAAGNAAGSSMPLSSQVKSRLQPQFPLQLQSSQTRPDPLWRSSPGPGVSGTMMSSQSQQTGSQQPPGAVLSQTVPGRHGGRPDMGTTVAGAGASGKGKKRRKVGF